MLEDRLVLSSAAILVDKRPDEKRTVCWLKCETNACHELLTHPLSHPHPLGQLVCAGLMSCLMG